MRLLKPITEATINDMPPEMQKWLISMGYAETNFCSSLIFATRNDAQTVVEIRYDDVVVCQISEKGLKLFSVKNKFMKAPFAFDETGRIKCI